jgi:hypothetical protein
MIFRNRLIVEPSQYHHKSLVGVVHGAKDACSPSDFKAVFLLSIGDAVRELGRPLRGELRRATAVAMSRWCEDNSETMTQRCECLAGKVRCRNAQIGLGN